MLKEYTAYFVVKAALDGEVYREAGFYPAESFSEAIGYIEEYYGENLAAVEHLELLDASLIHMDPEVAKEVLAEYFGNQGEKNAY